MENYPGNCFSGAASNDKLYRRKHNPFISFNNIRNNPKRCQNIVEANQLFVDLAKNNLPNFMYYTPNMNNDCHDTPLANCSAWFGPFINNLLKNDTFTKGTLIIVTFDEDEYIEMNHIYTVLLGAIDPAMVGKADKDRYDHYSLLRTVENNFNLGTLGKHDDTAVDFLKNVKPRLKPLAN